MWVVNTAVAENEAVPLTCRAVDMTTVPENDAVPLTVKVLVVIVVDVTIPSDAV